MLFWRSKSYLLISLYIYAPSVSEIRSDFDACEEENRTVTLRLACQCRGVQTSSIQIHITVTLSHICH